MPKKKKTKTGSKPKAPLQKQPKPQVFQYVPTPTPIDLKPDLGMALLQQSGGKESEFELEISPDAVLFSYPQEVYCWAIMMVTSSGHMATLEVSGGIWPSGPAWVTRIQQLIRQGIKVKVKPSLQRTYTTPKGEVVVPLIVTEVL